MPDPDGRAEVDGPPVVVAVGSEFSGLLALHTAGRIEGRVQGRIVAQDALWIAETAEVEADVEAGRLVVAGSVQGELHARERIELRATARVRGGLHAPRLVLEEGSVLNGPCQSGTAAPGSGSEPLPPADRS